MVLQVTSRKRLLEVRLGIESLTIVSSLTGSEYHERNPVRDEETALSPGQEGRGVVTYDDKKGWRDFLITSDVCYSGMCDLQNFHQIADVIISSTPLILI